MNSSIPQNAHSALSLASTSVRALAGNHRDNINNTTHSYSCLNTEPHGQQTASNVEITYEDLQ